MSWGTKTVHIHGKPIQIPKLARKKHVELMLREYKVEFPNKENRIGDTSFKKIVKCITNHDTKAKTAVDYVAGVYCTIIWVTFDK